MILQHEIEVLAGEHIDLILELRPIPMTVEQIDVQATPSGPLGEDVSTLRFEQQELLEPDAKVVEEEENPLFSDAFGKLELTPKPGRSLRANLLVSDDRLNFTENLGQITSAEPGEGDATDADSQILGRVRFRTNYVNGYAWGSHQAVLGRELHVESRVSASREERDRQGEEQGQAGTFELTDERQLTTLTVGQDWTTKISSRQELQWGIELRDLDADFDYFNERELTDPLATIGNRPPEGEIDFDQRFRGRQYAAYLGDRLRPVPNVTLDVGLRYDKNTVLDDSDVSRLDQPIDVTFAVGDVGRDPDRVETR